MKKNDPYLNYWHQQQNRQQQKNQQSAQQARKTLANIIQYLVQTFPIKKIILFGSLSRNKFTETSDIDIAVEGIPPRHYFRALAEVNSLSEHWVDLKPLEDLDPYFLQRITKTGEVIYASENRE